MPGVQRRESVNNERAAFTQSRSHDIKMEESETVSDFLIVVFFWELPAQSCL